MDSTKAHIGKYGALFPETLIPEEEWHTADAFLFEALERIGKLGIDTSFFNQYPKTLEAGVHKRIPLEDVYTLHCALIRALASVPGVTVEEAEECGWRLQKHCMRALGVEWAEYEKIIPTRYVFSDKILKSAVSHLQESVTLDFVHDFPSLAVYTPGENRTVFVDRRFARVQKLTNGTATDLVPFLLVHEVIEKALYDTFTLPERAYQSFHQVAQRIEQEAVEEQGISWKEYQDEIMEPAILMLADAPVRVLPPIVDIRPVVDAGDAELAERLRKADPSDNEVYANDMFTAKELMSGLLHLQFKDGKRMAEAMMRFQESYESPEFKGRHFAREEFETWYTQKKNGSTYADHWADEGFNVPGSAFSPFYEGWFSPLTEDEATVLRFLNTRDLKKTYVIATANASDSSVLGHEISHALYYLVPEYRKEAQTLLSRVDTSSVRNLLTTHPEYASYHEAVLDDEIHAYLGHSLKELEAEGLGVSQYRDVENKLRELYVRYIPET